MKIFLTLDGKSYEGAVEEVVSPPPPPPPPPAKPVGVTPRPPWRFPLDVTFDSATNTLTYHAPVGPSGWSQYLVDTFTARSHWAGTQSGPPSDVDAAVVAQAPPDTGGPRPPADPNDPNRVNLDLPPPNPPVVPPVVPPNVVPAATKDGRVQQLRDLGYTDDFLRQQGIIS